MWSTKIAAPPKSSPTTICFGLLIFFDFFSSATAGLPLVLDPPLLPHRGGFDHAEGKRRMKLPPCFCRWLLGHLLRRTAWRRDPDFVIGTADDPYLRRWWLIPRNPVFNLYVHHFLRSDDDRALHDHPWPSVSVILAAAISSMSPAPRRSCATWARSPPAARARRTGWSC